MKKALATFDLTRGSDYVRSVNEQGWSDFSLNAVQKILDSDSKYIIVSSYGVPPGKPANILICPNLSDVYKEAKHFVASNIDFDQTRTRIYCYFEDECTIRIGPKKSKFFTVSLKPVTLEDLLKRNVYSESMSHREIQLHLINLGIRLDFDVLVAANDRNALVNDIRLGDIAPITVNDLPLPEAISQAVKLMIDRIDILWMDRKTKKVFGSFEIERSKNWLKALQRLSECKITFSDSPPIPIVVCKRTDLNNLFQAVGFQSTPMYRCQDLKYITIDHLIEMIKQIDNVNSNIDFRRLFFKCYLKDLRSTALGIHH